MYNMYCSTDLKKNNGKYEIKIDWMTMEQK